MSTSDRNGSALTPAGPKYRGVYYRIDRAGERRFKIDYYDERGQRRWKWLPPGTNLTKAQAEREDLRAKRRRGEKFDPARTKVPTVAEWFDTWLEEVRVSVRPRTHEAYSWAGEKYIKPRLGHLKVADVDVEDVLRLVGWMQEQGRSAWTIRGVLVPLGLMLRRASRRRLRVGNPLSELEPGERPRLTKREVRLLTAPEMRHLLGAADGAYRIAFMLMLLGGLRISEALGLTWADVSFDTGAVHVRKQLGRDGTRAATKTDSAVRRLPWFEEPLRELRAWKLASAHSLAGDFVACTRTGRPLDHRTVGRALEAAVERAGLNVEGLPKLTPHSLRKIYSSAVEDAMRSEQASRTLSRSMGHSNEATTYGAYVHDYQGDEQDERTRALQRHAFGGVLSGAAETGARRHDLGADGGTMLR